MSTVQEQRTPPPLAAAAASTGAGPFGVLGPAGAIAVIVLGAVAVREALVSSGVTGGAPLLPGIAEAADRIAGSLWAIPLGLAGMLAGLVMTVTALRPRRHRGFAVSARSGIYLTRRDLARIASDAAGSVGGVLHARSSVSRDRVTTTVDALGAGPALQQQVRDTITERLRPLAEPPEIRVRVRPAGSDDSRRIA